ncbi:hypothetical protein WJX77_006240 [Trebouxia sp. C0004]
MARPRFAQESQATEDEEDELDLEEDQPDSPAPDTEVQARVDSIALAQKRLTAKSSEKSKFDGSSAPKSRFGRVKLPVETEEPASDEKKIKTSSGLMNMGRKLAQKLSLGKKEPKSVKISQQEPEVHDVTADANRVSFAPAPPAVIQVEASAVSEASSR